MDSYKHDESLINGYINPTIYSHCSRGRTFCESSMMWQEQLQRLKLAFLRIILTSIPTENRISTLQKPANKFRWNRLNNNMTSTKEKGYDKAQLAVCVGLMLNVHPMPPEQCTIQIMKLHFHVQLFGRSHRFRCFPHYGGIMKDG